MDLWEGSQNCQTTRLTTKNDYQEHYFWGLNVNSYTIDWLSKTGQGMIGKDSIGLQRLAFKEASKIHLRQGYLDPFRDRTFHYSKRSEIFHGLIVKFKGIFILLDTIECRF